MNHLKFLTFILVVLASFQANASDKDFHGNTEEEYSAARAANDNNVQLEPGDKGYQAQRDLADQGEVSTQVEQAAAKSASQAGSESKTSSASAEEAAQACLSAGKVANASCATLSLFGMDPGQAMMAESLLAAIPSLIGSMQRNSGNISQMCKDQEKLNKAIGSLSAIKGAACLMTINKCVAKCEIESETLGNLDPKKKAETKAQIAACNAYKSQQMMMVIQTAFSLKNALQASQCADETKIADIPIPSPSPFQPGNVVAGCDNPTYAASNPVCICQKDPKNKICSNQNAGWNQGGSGGTTNAGGISSPGGDDFGDLDDGKAVDDTVANADNQRGGPKDSGGGGGGGPSSAGGQGGLNGGDGGGGGGDPGIDKNVITGQSGSGGGGNAYIGAGSTSGGGRGTASRDDDMDSKTLMGLVPKGRYTDRSTAGMTLPAVDGATGPMGPTLWEKVSNQVQTQDQKMPFLNGSGR
ncbi:MAG TPA: hypothetical protein VM432_14080 [Bdellovibrionales bacterium]|nr:hypothetical protein [Bdellovibrionales bacterium]